MADTLNRRDFMTAATGAGLLAAARPLAAGSPTMITQSASRPVVVASGNGHRFRNGGQKTCVETAFEMMTKGADVLDALIAGVNIVELDPEDTSVGYGGLPNADGVVQLDASVMHGPRKRAGAVGALEGVKTPSLVAKQVLERTDHHLIVGKDAQVFARNMGFEILPDLNTARSRAAWLEWKKSVDPTRWIKDPVEREAAERKVLLDMIARGLVDEQHVYGTINCNGVNAKGDVCGVTTTSGLAWKIPGRLGDSPILGAGLYVDGDVGAAGSTGRGEANLFGLCSYLVVEEMRRGRHPKDAGLEACRRIKANTIEKRLLNSRGEPNFNVNFYVINRRGEYAGVALYSPGKGGQFAVCDDKGPRVERIEPLLSGSPND
jgi:N4-(beta-N-acetylglucosaminyl)-L-asparaginase